MIKPFSICLFIEILILSIRNRLPAINDIIKGGGIGPGSYFPIMYLQCWIVIPFISYVDRKVSLIKTLLLFGFICIVLESVFVGIDNRAWLWRLLCIRYLMVLCVAVMSDKIYKKKWWLILSLISIVIATIENCCYPFDNLGWPGYHCYEEFYILLLILFLKKIDYKLFRIAGKYSYEIFLIQMAFFAIITKNDLQRFLGFFNNGVWIIFSCFSIFIITYFVVVLKNKINI